jgi:broad specificity phosphatase PhoE
MNPTLNNRLYLVRHGENPANISKVFSSRIVDQSLTSKGVLQAQQTAARFKQLDISKEKWARTVYSSPLRRAIETAEIIAKSLDVEVRVMEEFREIGVGILEERQATKSDWVFHEQVMGDWFEGKSETGFPGGENYLDLWTRMRTGLLEITLGLSDKNIIVVGHGGIMSVTMKDLCPEVEASFLQTFKWDNCAITEVDLQRTGDRIYGRLVKWNDHSHLEGEAAELVPGVPTDL